GDSHEDLSPTACSATERSEARLRKEAGLRHFFAGSWKGECRSTANTSGSDPTTPTTAPDRGDADQAQQHHRRWVRHSGVLNGPADVGKQSEFDGGVSSLHDAGWNRKLHDGVVQNDV